MKVRQTILFKLYMDFGGFYCLLQGHILGMGLGHVSTISGKGQIYFPKFGQNFASEV